MKNVIKLATEMSTAFETKTRDDGSKFICLKDGAPDWMSTIVHTVHGDQLPDDTTYRFIELAVDTISECDDDATEDDIIERLYDEIGPDIYTSDLTNWLNAQNNHVYYLTEALKEFDVKDGFQALSMAQKMQIDEVAYAVLEALKELADN